MINNLLSFLTYENIYLFANWGVIPFWLLLIFIPQHQLTNFFAQSVIAPLLLGLSYAYLSYLIYLDGDIFDGFELYNGLDGLYSMFANGFINFLVVLAISLFAGSWIVRVVKYLIHCYYCIINTYFSGPIGLIVYWFIKFFR